MKRIGTTHTWLSSSGDKWYSNNALIIFNLTLAMIIYRNSQMSPLNTKQCFASKREIKKKHLLIPDKSRYEWAKENVEDTFRKYIVEAQDSQRLLVLSLWSAIMLFARDWKWHMKDDLLCFLVDEAIHCSNSQKKLTLWAEAAQKFRQAHVFFCSWNHMQCRHYMLGCNPKVKVLEYENKRLRPWR